MWELTSGDPGSSLDTMSTPRTCLLALALALLAVPLLGTGARPCAPTIATGPVGEAGGAAGPTWFSGGSEVPAAPESGASREAPESFTAAAPAGSATAGGPRPGYFAAREGAAPGARIPLFLRHCAFLC